MPIIVSCPTCSGQLRVADDLIGRKVRCPACHAIFEATELAPPPPEEEPPSQREPRLPSPGPDISLETMPPAPLPDDVPLEKLPPAPIPSLSLDTEKEEPAGTPDGDPFGKLRVVEIDLPPGERSAPQRPAPQPREEEEEEPRRRRFEREDEDDDRRTGGSRYYMPRRDCEPHRGGLVLTMGVLSLVLTFVCGLVPVSLIFGIIAWVLGSSDLKKIGRGEMDPMGEGNTQAGYVCGIIGTSLSALIILGCGGLWLFVHLSVQQTSKNLRQQQPGIAAPPPAAPPGQKF